MRTIEVKIVPNARKNSIEEEGSRYKIHVMAPAADGKANKALIEILAEYLHVRKSSISIVRGETSRVKFLKIED